MDVSPQAREFSDIREFDPDEFQRIMANLPNEKQISEARLESATVTGSKKVLQDLQDDLRKAGYRKRR